MLGLQDKISQSLAVGEHRVRTKGHTFPHQCVHYLAMVELV